MATSGKAIWFLIDGTTAAMFSSITTCRPAMPDILSEIFIFFFFGGVEVGNG